MQFTYGDALVACLLRQRLTPALDPARWVRIYRARWLMPVQYPANAIVDKIDATRPDPTRPGS